MLKIFQVDFKKHKLVVPLKPTLWPRERAERISINSFGIGGSNAHVIIDSTEQFLADNPTLARSYASTSNAYGPAMPRLLLFSANVAESVKQFAKQCIDYAQRRPKLLGDLAYTLASRREKLQHRSYALVSASGIVAEPAPTVKVSPRERPKIFAFSGQGAQWPQMGQELIMGHPVFSQTIDELDDVLKTLKQPPNWSLRGEYYHVRDFATAGALTPYSRAPKTKRQQPSSSGGAISALDHSCATWYSEYAQGIWRHF